VNGDTLVNSLRIWSASSLRFARRRYFPTLVFTKRSCMSRSRAAIIASTAPDKSFLYLSNRALVRCNSTSVGVCSMACSMNASDLDTSRSDFGCA
jgi:hypothetical protein